MECGDVELMPALPCRPQELPRFKELIFEDFSQFLLVENLYEEVVLQSVSKDIMMGEGAGRGRGYSRLLVEVIAAV